MIMIVHVCKEKLHYFEFVKPIEDILTKNKIKFFTKYYNELIENDLRKADRVVICGTSLADNEFMKHLDKFLWIRGYNKPVLGICAGMQIIGKTFGGRLKKKAEIGFYKENFSRNFLGVSREQEVYHLHNYHVDDLEGFETYCKSNGITQAVKHKEKEIYGVLFHPEVRQKTLILHFAS